MDNPVVIAGHMPGNLLVQYAGEVAPQLGGLLSLGDSTSQLQEDPSQYPGSGKNVNIKHHRQKAHTQTGFSQFWKLDTQDVCTSRFSI